MIKYYLISGPVPNGTVAEMALGSLVVPNGKKWTFSEIRPTLLTKTVINLYVQNEKVGTFDNLANADIQSRMCNWTLDSGQVVQVTATNADSSAHIIGVEFTINEQ